MIDFQRLLGNVRETAPLVHCITNYVTANDCANLLLACGASPVMADDPEEVEEITANASGLLLNLGTISRLRASTMLLAGKRANALGHPVVLDPVGVGASTLRAETARKLLAEVRLAAIRGNASEVRTLAQGGADGRGVDTAAAPDAAHADWAVTLARRTGAVVAMTGAVDTVTDGVRVCHVVNGCPMMARVTGTGCMLSALAAAFAAANPEQGFEAVCAAVAAMGLCGEKALGRLGPRDGNMALRNFMIDAAYHLNAEDLEEGAKYEM